MITVYLYGHLKKLFGAKYVLDISSPAEAVRALEANNPNRFLQEFTEHDYHVVRGKDLETGEPVSADMLTFQSKKQDIHFVPVVAGSKSKGLGLAIAGVLIVATAGYGALLAAGFVGSGGTLTAGLGLALAEGAGATFLGVSYGTMMMFGASLAFAGIAQMLSPTPEDQSTEESFIFNGGSNIYGQGSCIPLVIGEVEVGTVVISESLTAEETV